MNEISISHKEKRALRSQLIRSIADSSDNKHLRLSSDYQFENYRITRPPHYSRHSHELSLTKILSRFESLDTKNLDMLNKYNNPIAPTSMHLHKSSIMQPIQADSQRFFLDAIEKEMGNINTNSFISQKPSSPAYSHFNLKPIREDDKSKLDNITFSQLKKNNNSLISQQEKIKRRRPKTTVETESSILLKDKVSFKNTNLNELTAKDFSRAKTREIKYISKGEGGRLTEIPFNQLSVRMKFRRIYLKITIVLLFNYIWSRMKFYGLNVLKAEIQEEIQNFEFSKIKVTQDQPSHARFCISSCYFHPFSRFFDYWNIVRILLHTYSMTYMVYFILVCDEPKAFSLFWVLDYLVELLFLCDMLIIFGTGYFKKSELITNHFSIANNYLQSWFVIDFVSLFPFEIFFTTHKYALSSRPTFAFHRIARVFNNGRIHKLVKHYESLGFIKKLMQYRILDHVLKKLRLNAGISRLINTFLLVLILSHIFACLWFYIAKLDNFNESTWVVRNNLMEANPYELYLSSIYYILTVVTTCGFGDIYSVTVMERIVTCVWMVVGVAFYSFVISNLSSIITSMDFQSSLLQHKLDSLNEITKKLKIPDDMYLKIKKVYEDNDNQYYIQDENDLFEDLPYSIKVEILYHIHNEKIMSNVYLLDRNVNLVVEIMSNWKTVIFSSHEIVYLEDETPYDIFFVCTGSLTYLNKLGNKVTMFKNGGMVGEVEPVLGIMKRFLSVRADVIITTANIIKVEDFKNILIKYSIDLQDTIKMVKKKYEKYLGILQLLENRNVMNQDIVCQINEHKSTRTYLQKLGYKSSEATFLIDELEVCSVNPNNSLYGSLQCNLDDFEVEVKKQPTILEIVALKEVNKMTNQQIEDIERFPLKFFRTRLDLRTEKAHKTQSVERKKTKSLSRVYRKTWKREFDGVELKPQTTKDIVQHNSLAKVFNFRSGDSDDLKKKVQKRSCSLVSAGKNLRETVVVIKKEQNNSPKDKSMNENYFPDFYTREDSKINNKDNASEVSGAKYNKEVKEIVQYFDDYITLINTLNGTFSIMTNLVKEISDDHKFFLHKMGFLDQRLQNLEDKQHSLEDNLELDL